MHRSGSRLHAARRRPRQHRWHGAFKTDGQATLETMCKRQAAFMRKVQGRCRAEFMRLEGSTDIFSKDEEKDGHD